MARDSGQDRSVPGRHNYLRRLAGMSWHEIYTRSRQEAAKRWDVLLHRLGTDPFRGSSADGPATDPRGRFFCDPADVPRIVEILRRQMPGDVDLIVSKAERIVERRFDLLGYHDLDFGRDINWSSDPVHDKRAPFAPWPAVRFLEFDAVGDHKVIWELNRHQFLITLAKAYRITGDERFAASLKDLWYDWQRKNPYPMEVNWASTLEVAFRALSWMWAAFLLEGTPADAAPFRQDLEREIGRAAWYIHRFLSTYFSPNTHLLGEGTALFLIGARYPGLSGAARWRRTGWEIVLRESQRQVLADGLHFEQSIYYHVYALDFLLHARILAARHDVAVPERLNRTIHGMASALALLSQAGALPRFGDDDGGRLFDGARNRPEHMLDPLATAAVLFRQPRFKTSVGELREETLWLLGPESEAAFHRIPCSAPAPQSVALPACGIYAMTDRGPPPRQLFIDAGPLGPLSAGHGHADALSLQLAAGGRLWLTDPGTFCYSGAGSEREKFRGTPAHNTLTVDGRDQADPTGLFSWGALPRVEVLRWVTGETFDFFEGAHSGYSRLPEPVSHRRSILRLDAGFWLVRDVVEGQGTHDLDVYWHFAPDVRVQPADNGSGAISCRDGELLGILPTADIGWKRTVEMEDYSPAYGLRVLAPVVRWNTRAPCPAEFAAIIAFGMAPDASFQRLEDVHGAVGYEYGTAHGRHQFFFATSKQEWRSGGWASDAAMLCFSANASGVRELTLVGGSRVEYAGETILASPEPLSQLECRYDGNRWRVAPSASGSSVQPKLDGLPDACISR